MFSQLLNISNYYFNPYAIPVMVVGILIFSIGFFVLKQNTKSIINIAFFFQCFTVSLWVLPISIVYLSRAPEVALIWYRYFTFFGVVNIMPSLIFLAMVWLGEFKTKTRFIIANYFIGFIFYILAVTTDKIISPRTINKYFWGFYPIYRPLAVLFLLTYAAQFLTGLFNLYRAYKKEIVPNRKMQIWTMITATLIGATASADFIPKFFKISLYPYGYIPISIYVYVVAYSIIRYKTFDIETAIHKTLMWLLSFSFIVIPVLLLYWWILPRIEGALILQ
ncbi:MAG: hypothetical protein NC828_03890, partial [Candidatus Omnitrophica bacterium]|nr:hypothetical protein [Candidatus Omnitrophota bacterium]